jgi:tRNA-specific 2-thiouridylase
MEKALVLYSGGLDSRLVVRVMKEQGFEVEALSFKLPFGCSACSSLDGLDVDDVRLSVFDVSKDPLLSEYLDILKSPKFGTGSGINPCKDCKIFMFRKAKEYFDEHGFDVIASGEVLGQRPMSQTGGGMKMIDEELGFEVLRPLCAKRLTETSYEKDGLVDREKLFDISGRGRKGQMELAEKFGISYPSPGGGCFLCEKWPAKRIRKLLDEDMINEKSLPLVSVGRHFWIDGVWFVVARDSVECEVILNFENSIKDDYGKPAVYFSDEKGREKAKELQEAYSTGEKDEERAKFAEVKI